MTLRIVVVLVAAASLLTTTGCIGSNTTKCGTSVCGPSEVCYERIDPPRCVQQSEISACDGRSDGEVCVVDPTAAAPFHCASGLCVLGTCGDGFLDAGEACDDGAQNALTPDACRPNCQEPFCGDGVVDSGETCDDGNTDIGDGCTPDCRSTEQCGNGELDLGAGEECDDGNTSAGDGCGPTCLYERCGNGVTDPGEVCDDGNPDSGDGCTPDCLSDESCGNGRVDPAAGEGCDCGADLATKPASCTAPNGDDASECTANCQVRFCGNGIVDPGETCDDGNLTPADGCGPTCQTEGCGNGFIDVAIGEECDDGNLASRDGCSSGCTVEPKTWLPRSSELGPRSLVSMAYDEARQRVVLFGGLDNNGRFLDETWEFDGARWLRVVTFTSPTPRGHGGMVYDRARARMVLFGGAAANSVLLDDTWVFDGSNWTALAPANSPPPMLGHAMAYDSGRDRVVLFGGGGAGGDSRATWEFEGTDWTENTAALATAPTARQGVAMAYDEGRGVVVVHAGRFGCCTTADGTFEYDGTSWTTLTPTTNAPQRSYHSMAYDPDRGGVVFFGGFHTAPYVGDTWFFDGTGWTEDANTGPAGRRLFGLAYDRARSRLVLFGGSSTALYGDTWEFDGTAWAEPTIVFRPAARREYAIAYDRVRERVVLFGGRLTDGTFADDTWEWDGVNWVETTDAVRPPARVAHVMTYDPVRGQTVLFGGYRNSSPWGYDDTWAYDAAGWRQITTTTKPQLRWFHSLTFHPPSGNLILQGGYAGGVGLADTWAFDGNDWSSISATIVGRFGHATTYDASRQRIVRFGGELIDTTWEFDGAAWADVTAATRPGARRYHGLAWAPALRASVLFGGDNHFGSLGDTWELAGGTWTPQSPPFSPPPRQQITLVYADSLRGVVLFGGNGGPAGVLNDVWVYRHESTWPDEICGNGNDDDGDGLADCADPDCSGTLDCGCASGRATERFGVDMVGCGDTESYANRANLCGAGWHVCTAADWVARRRRVVPTHNYWTDDDLLYSGTNGACFVSTSTGSTCPYPMRVCGSTSDPLGNTCGWTGCGYETNTPVEHFGGCQNDATAGALCCK